MTALGALKLFLFLNRPLPEDGSWIMRALLHRPPEGCFSAWHVGFVILWSD